MQKSRTTHIVRPKRHYSFIARLLFLLNIKPKWTTNIAEQLTCGYGKLSSNGFWQFELWTEH